MSVLHSLYKDMYFKEASWLSHLIDNACKVLRKEFHRAYKGCDNAPAPKTTDDGAAGGEARLSTRKGKKSQKVCHISNCHVPRIPQPMQAANIFDSLHAPFLMHACPGMDELACYFALSTEDTDNPLQWWREHQDIFSRLSQMALDYLSISGMSCITSFILAD